MQRSNSATATPATSSSHDPTSIQDPVNRQTANLPQQRGQVETPQTSLHHLSQPVPAQDNAAQIVTNQPLTAGPDVMLASSHPSEVNTGVP